MTGQAEERKASDEVSLSAIAFKVQMDEGRKLVYVRIYSGVLKVGMEVYNPRLKKGEKVSRIFQMHAHHRDRVEEAKAGEIIAVMGLKETTTGDTLCDRAHPILLEPIDFYKPVMSIAVEPRTNKDQEKLNESLEKLSEEDPTFLVRFDEDTGQTVISGMGELHLDVLVSRLRTEYNLEVNVGRPQVVYRETVEKEAEASAKFMKEMDDVQHFADVSLRISSEWQRKGHRVSVRDSGGGFVPGRPSRRRAGSPRGIHCRGHYGLSPDGHLRRALEGPDRPGAAIPTCPQDCCFQCPARRMP